MKRLGLAILVIGLMAVGCGKGKSPELASGTGLTKALETKDSMVLIPAGSFWMGSPEGQGHLNEHPRHEVWVDAYLLDLYEVTFDQYDKFAEATGREKPGDEGWGRGKRPVININWNDADAFCRWAGKRLPIEAEWEKAAWAGGPFAETPVLHGTGTAYFWAKEPKPLDLFAWYMNNSNRTTHPVGEKQPNPFGLYDLLGNVWEWCSDWYEGAYDLTQPEKNPKGPESGERKVLRGGAWDGEPVLQRPAYRIGFAPGELSSNIGCRCAKTP